jgi:hypothetical protein
MRKQDNQLYQKLLESGVVNSNVTTKDLNKLLKEQK